MFKVVPVSRRGRSISRWGSIYHNTASRLADNRSMHACALLQPCSPYIESHRVAPTPPTCQHSPTPQLPHSPTLSFARPFLRVSRFLTIELSYSPTTQLPRSLT